MPRTRPKPAAMPMKRCSKSRKNGFSLIRKLKIASVPMPPTSTVATCQVSTPAMAQGPAFLRRSNPARLPRMMKAITTSWATPRPVFNISDSSTGLSG